MASKSAGIILYPEDIKRIKNSVKPEYQFAVIWALAQYATDGVMPTESELGEGGMVAFEFIFEKVADALQTYKSNSEKRKAAANARWSANESEQMQTDANACKCIQADTDAPKTENKNINIKNKKVVVENISNNSFKPTTSPIDDGLVLGIDGSDLHEDIERNQIADGLILRYRLGRDDVTREALIADLAEYGEAKMREVLNTAASSNKYDKISVKFWRAILNNNGSRASPKDTGILPGQVYRSRQYTPDDYKSIEVNLDELDSHGRLPGEAGYGT